MPTTLRAKAKKVASSATPSPKAASFIPRALRGQAEVLCKMQFDCMDNEVFKKPNIEQTLFSFEREPELPPTSWYHPTRDDLFTGRVAEPPPLMSVAEEKLMFLRFNYAKRKLTELQQQIKKRGLTRDSAEKLIEWHRRFEHFREYLVRTNLGLVLAMAKRMRLGEGDFAEVVSEGNMALMRAVDKFDLERGFKFSTYACRAILKAFSRTSQKLTKHRLRFGLEFEPSFEKSDWSERRHSEVESDCIDELKTIVEQNLADLSNVEQTVIRSRFNWQESADDASLTLEEVGRMIGLTKERVRQIQNKALAKIRVRMEETVLRTRSTPPDHLEIPD